ncbi:hypothetical protein QYE76_000140 [Lolium multiflorum]|uniref:CCHC-type domain-containing protein n=1 Tax=Lolium multiflorum TaxID=4521 RepID=A0AAD8RJI5_LOLMU|nr:hypothetical protein QYE76_000140 [Lolium multiflorum]
MIARPDQVRRHAASARSIHLHPPATHSILPRHGPQAAARFVPQPLAAGIAPPQGSCLLPAPSTAGALPPPGPAIPAAPRCLPAPALPSPELATPPFPAPPGSGRPSARDGHVQGPLPGQRPRPPGSRGKASCCTTRAGGRRHAARLRPGRSPPLDRRSPLRREEQLPHNAAPTAAKKKKKPKKNRAGAGGAAGGAVGGSQVGNPPMAPPQGRVFDGRADTQVVVSAPPEKSPTSNICFNCGEMGHFRSDCTLPEQCLFCGDPAHLAAACKERFNSRRRREVIEYLGHGIDGGFYYIDLGGRSLVLPSTLQ